MFNLKLLLYLLFNKKKSRHREINRRTIALNIIFRFTVGSKIDRVSLRENYKHLTFVHATIGRIPRIVQLLRVKKEEEEEEGGGGGISRLAKSQREENTSTLFRPFVTSSFTIRYEASVVSLTRRHRSVSNEFSHSLVYFPPFFYVSQGKKVFHQRDQRDTEGNRPLAQN